MKIRHVLMALSVLALALLADDALAQSATQADAKFDGLLDLIRQNASQWHDRLGGYARNVFWSLATIQLVWTFMPLVFKQADISETLGELVRTVLVLGFFFALLTYSAEWGQAIIDSFRQAGGTAAGRDSAMQPSDMFATAVEFADTIGNTKTWNPLVAVAVSLSACVVLLCFAFIAAFMAVTLVESYIVINAAVLFMGFGASQWTREYAIAMPRYAVAVGAKLFVLTLLVGLIVSSAKQWQVSYSHDQASMWTMVGLAFVCAYLAKTIPDLIQSLITGTSISGGSTIGMMATTAVAGAGVAATAVTAGAAAPAAAGATAAGAGGTGVAGGSGLAQALNASIAGQSAGAATGGTASAGGSVGGMMSAGPGKAAQADSPRIGSGNASASGPTPKPETAAGSSGAGGLKHAAKVASPGSQQGDEQRHDPAPPPSSAVSSSASEKKEGGPILAFAQNSATMAGMVLRPMAALSVPGMEGVAQSGAAAAPPGGDDDSSAVAPASQEAEVNTIRPALPAASTGESSTTERLASPPRPLGSLRVPGMDMLPVPKGGGA